MAKKNKKNYDNIFDAWLDHFNKIAEEVGEPEKDLSKEVGKLLIDAIQKRLIDSIKDGESIPLETCEELLREGVRIIKRTNWN